VSRRTVDPHGIVNVALTRAHRAALRQAIGEVQAGAMSDTWDVESAEALSDAFDALWAAEDV
jgi:hypothetical protein